MRLIALLAVALLVPVADADARPRKKKAAKAGSGVTAACGMRLLPLAVGNTWTYATGVAPAPPLDAVKRISPAQPKQIVITVKSIDTKGADTVIKLEETFQVDRVNAEKKASVEERTIMSTIICNDKKFDITPESFFFAGEPGGSVNLEVTKFERVKGTSIQLTKGAIGEAEWREDLIVQWAQKPTDKTNAKLASGKLELERRFTPQDPEPITTKMGMYRCEKLGLITTGRVTLENASPQHKPMELPAGWISTLWMSDDVGLVQALNSYGHMYQLVDMKLDGAPGGVPSEVPEAPAKTATKKKKQK